MTEPTAAEVARSLDRIESKVDRDSDKIDSLSTETVRLRESTDGALTHISARIAVLEAWQTWAMRVVLGLVMVAVVGLILTN